MKTCLLKICMCLNCNVQADELLPSSLCIRLIVHVHKIVRQVLTLNVGSPTRGYNYCFWLCPFHLDPWSVSCFMVFFFPPIWKATFHFTIFLSTELVLALSCTILSVWLTHAWQIYSWVALVKLPQVIMLRISTIALTYVLYYLKIYLELFNLST